MIRMNLENCKDQFKNNCEFLFIGQIQFINAFQSLIIYEFNNKISFLGSMAVKLWKSDKMIENKIHRIFHFQNLAQRYLELISIFK